MIPGELTNLAMAATLSVSAASPLAALLRRLLEPDHVAACGGVQQHGSWMDRCQGRALLCQMVQHYYGLLGWVLFVCLSCVFGAPHAQRAFVGVGGFALVCCLECR